MRLIARNRTSLRRLLILSALALLAGALAACAALKDLRTRATVIAGSVTGMKCLMTSVGPCFPWGIKASGITICSTSGEPLFQAKELRAQVSLQRFLQKNGRRSELFDTFHGDQVKLTLTRNDRGEWNSPLTAPSQKLGGSGPVGKAVRRHFFFTNVTIVVQTEKGIAERFYESVEADVDPGHDTVTLKLAGNAGTARIEVTKGAVKRYELQANEFPLALLAPAPELPHPLENLFLSGNLKATTDDNENFTVEGSGTITIRNLRNPVLSSGTIDGMSLPFDLKGDLSSNGMENISARISFGGEPALIRGSIRGWEKPVLDVTSTFVDFSYDRAFSALPPSLHPSIPDIRLGGSMTGTFRMHLDTAAPDSLDYSYSGRMDRVEILSLGQEVDMERLKGPFLHKVRIGQERNLVLLLGPDNPEFTPYRKIPFSLRSAVMAAEDLGFFSHRGFSKENIRRSFIENLKAGRVVRGASTISMQLAKNLFLSPERTLSRKLEEALITMALEQNLDKRRILEIYLNIIEWGDGIYGIGQASRYYFGKSPERLSPVESAFLASIIARPKNWHPDPLPKLRTKSRGHLRVILHRMYAMGAADIEDLVVAGVSEATIDRITAEEADEAGPAGTADVPPQFSPPFPPLPF